jgi:hypothetical protein
VPAFWQISAYDQLPRLPVIDAGGFKKAPREKAGGQAGFEL